MNERLPEVLNLETGDFSSYRNFLFWLEEGNDVCLYRIKENGEPEKHTLPSYQYNTKEKLQHMKHFIEQKNIDFKIKGNEIFLFDKNNEAYMEVTAPIYTTSDTVSCYLKSKKFKDMVPTPNFLKKSKYFVRKHHEKINSEEVIYDLNMLSLDGGLCAFMEDYDTPLSCLNDYTFYVYNIGTNPNTEDEPFHEYTKTYLDSKVGPRKPLQNAVIFNLLKIKKYMESAEYDPNIGLRCVLPKKVTGVAIGKGGCNIETIKFGIGIPKLTFIPYDCPPKER